MSSAGHNFKCAPKYSEYLPEHEILKRVSYADTDVALVAFFSTATITFGTVIVAYLSDSLHGAILNDVDLKVVACAQRHLKAVRRRVFKSEGKKPKGNQSERHARTETIAAFILTLSDQQLVTGLAILIAGTAYQGSVLGLEFSFILYLAWFSSITHLVTLDVLRDYFQRRSIARNIRIAGMLVIFALLAYSFLLVSTGIDLYSPVLCAYKTGSFELNVSSEYVVELCTGIAVFLFLVWSYTIRIGDAFSNERELRYLFSVIYWRLSLRQRKGLSHSQFVQERKARSRLRSVSRVQRTKRTRRLFYILVHGLHLYHESFLSSLPSIMLGYTYGITNIAILRWTHLTILPKQSLRLSFGQLVALLLLLLPCLAAAEAYHELHYRISSMNNESKGDKDSNLPPSGPARRASAPDILGSKPHTADLMRHGVPSTVDAATKAQTVKIQKYFCKERRKLLMSRAIELEAIEEGIGAEVAVGMFFFEAALAVCAGVLLVPFGDWLLGYLVGNSFFLIWVVASIFYLTVRTIIVCRDAGRANELVKEHLSFPLNESEG